MNIMNRIMTFPTHPDCLDQDHVVTPGLAEEDGLVGRPRHSAQVTS